MTERDVREAAELSLFLSIGVDETVAKNAVKNVKFAKTLGEVIAEADISADQGCHRSKGNLIYAAASKFPANALVHRPVFLSYVMSDKIKSMPQLDGALDFLKKLGGAELDLKSLEESAGVGVVVTADQIKTAVAECIVSNEGKLNEERYHCNINILLGQVGKVLKWADGATVKAELELQVDAFLGPKTEDDLKPLEKKKTKPAKEAKPAAEDATKRSEVASPAEQSPPDDPYSFFPKPHENNIVHTTIDFSDGRVMHIANSPEKLKAHIEATGGRIVTRFPPEPNGYLHIGHAKAMFVDFGMARQYDGVCFLRYDDTNPEAEKLEYIEHIQEIVAWMGWKPWKITYSSDYFDQLYDFAVELIKRGHAYVCHQTKDEIEASREARVASPWRDRPTHESLSLFEDMRRGLVDEGKATLRMKMDHRNANYNMFDLIAYRIKFTPHPHAGDKWCVYPSYDYAHCLVDALENITHSLCTLEFETRRASYYWLLEVLDTYKPFVWEYARLNITHNVMSKRKLNKLVTGGLVKGWDDPRLLTLAGLRRRGVSPTSINAFCKEIGITRAENLVHMHKLEHHIRMDLDVHSARSLAVLRPLKLVITNLSESHFESFHAKRFPGRSEETYAVPLTRIVYIESTDFKETDEKDYYGLAPGKSIMLRYAYVVKYAGHVKDPATGRITEVHVEAELDSTGKKPPKGILNWVSQPSPGQDPPTAEARIYDYLFKSEDPTDHGDVWLEDMNKDSLEVVHGMMLSPSLAKASIGDKFQLERLGYFCVDPDSNPAEGKMVFNRTVSLKSSPSSKQVAT